MKKLMVLVLVLAVAGIANGALIANFPLDEGSGTGFDETVSNNDGTISGLSWANLGSRYVLNMNSSGGTADAPNAAILGIETTDKMSIDFFSRGVGEPTAPSHIMNTGDSWIHHPYWLGTWGVTNWSHSTPQAYIEATVANADMELWHMWTYTKDSATGDVEIFMDGSSIVSGTNGDAAIESTGSFRLNGAGTEPFEGLIANVSVWDSVMTSGEMTTAYNAGVAEGLTGDAVPEPMTIALLGLGGLFLRRRK